VFVSFHESFLGKQQLFSKRPKLFAEINDHCLFN